MKRSIAFAALALGFLAAPAAQGAQSWGLPGEEIVRFEAKVVDVLCELTGNCPDNCGGGARQLGLLMDDGTLVPAFKNVTPFSGAALELIDFCGKRVTADGLFTTNKGHRIFALQFVREAPDGKWRRANRFLMKWTAANGLPEDSPKAKQWFRNDPLVERVIEADGVFGLGAEADKAYFEANP